jgi:hypothetical protein
MHRASEAKSPAFERINAYDSFSSYYVSPKSNRGLQRPKEQFEDEVEESPNFHLIDPRRRDSCEGNSNSSRHSKVQDMFESQFSDRLKKSMQHGSLYGGMNQEDML